MGITELLEKRVLLLDGAMGTMIQRLHLSEDDYRGERFADHSQRLAGCNDLLCLTRRADIASIHKAYLDAGADIISTNTFNANAISMHDYGLERYPGLIMEINREAASIALAEAEAAAPRKWDGRAFVAGSVGPTNRTASMSPDVADPAMRNVTYDELFAAYSEQVEGLLEGGVDLLLFETVFDTLNLKAGLDAANSVMDIKGKKLPVLISATVSDKAGRTLSGQTLSAFVTSIEDYDNVVSLGLNCSFGLAEIISYVRELNALTRHFVSSHPNAGLPDALGEYAQTPELFAAHVGTMLRERLLNIAGGCCGTTPEHIAALAPLVEHAEPRLRPTISPALRISGLERVEVLPRNNFLNVGERCNVAGSRKFLRLIKEKNYAEAMAIALRQVEDGAMVIDINMDDPLLDARDEMVRFLRYIASDPDIAKVPVMVDSSNWEVVEAALKNIQGKSIVNSISLKEGEKAFVARARRIRQLGAAVIVMAFDEEGQADTFQRKIDVCQRAYRLLTEKCAFRPDDIIFDVNIMAVATGMEEHARYGIDFIEAVAWIKKNLPGVRTSGGVSNLSFAFRGKNYLREAMHAVFLYHAVRAGLDMGIVNPATSVTYEEIEPKLRGLIEDVILARRVEAPDELAEFAANSFSPEKKETGVESRDTSADIDIRLTEAIVKGNSRSLTEDLNEALSKHGLAVKIIEGPLMEGMNRVGQLFGEGKMFLPQVVKTARTMKQAVDYLRPFMESTSEKNVAKAGKVVFATVKGDVHDIGKNIVSIVLACNNYEVIDLGVMVPPEKIIDTVKRENPDLVCLSGLITPSLAEMVTVARMMEKEGLSTPLLVGGATTSRIHTALKISPVYSAPVVHVTDASQNPIVASRLINPSLKNKYIAQIEDEYRRIRNEYTARKVSLIPLDEARKKARKINWEDYTPPLPEVELGKSVLLTPSIGDLIPFINWKMLMHAWRLTGPFMEKFPYCGCEGCVMTWLDSLDDAERSKGKEALRLYADAKDLLSELSRSGKFDGKCAVAFYRSNSKGDNLKIGSEMIPLLRQQREGTDCLCLADYVAPEGAGEDVVGVFAATSGRYLADESHRLKEDDEYGALLRQSVADRLAEAMSEWLHCKVRRQLWGYAQDETLTPAEMLRGDFKGIRPAAGYPMLPDQTLVKKLAQMIPIEAIGVEVTENGAMLPSATVCGLYISHPESRYFIIGECGSDQISDYASRCGVSETRMRQILRL